MIASVYKWLALCCYLVVGLSGAVRDPIVLGNEVLRRDNYAPLLGYRIAILTNPTGVFMDSMNLIVDEMAQDERLNVVAVLSPEHGFRGDKQAETGDPLFYIDKPTGLPVFSAYNMTTEQLAKVLQDMNIEAVLVDMQDVGVRLYTFVWTMYEVMEATSIIHKRNESSVLRVVITDRPNPLGGELVDGPLVNMSCCASGYGRLPIPFLHGMTIGELGLLFNGALHIPSDFVIVVKMLHWERHMSWVVSKDAAFLYPPWIPPSPNLPTVMSAHTYGAIVFLEATTAAEGRGTTTPFTMFGAPFLDAEDFAARLNQDFNCPSAVSNANNKNKANNQLQPQQQRQGQGSGFRAAYFQPTWSKYNGTVVPGVQWFPWRTAVAPQQPTASQDQGQLSTAESSLQVSADINASPFASGIKVLCAIRDLASPADAFVWDGSWFGHPGTELIDFYAGTPTLREMVDAGAAAEDIIAVYQPDVLLFRQHRKQYLLY